MSKFIDKVKYFFKNKYDRIERKDVVDAICQLEKEEYDLEESFADKAAEIDSLLEKGKNEKSRDLKLFWAKKINHLKAERENDIQHAMLLLYNIKLLGRLKDAIDDKNFIASVNDMPLNKLLLDQKGLAKFLNKALNTKVATEDVLTGADNVFAEVQKSYEPNKDIYGVGQSEDQLLAMFETEETLKMENDAQAFTDKAQSAAANKDTV